MSLTALFPIFFILSIVCIALFLILRLIYSVNVWFLIIFPLIVLLPIFLIFLGALIDYHDVQRKLKPILFTFYYFILSCLILIFYIFTGLIFFVLPILGVFFIIFILIGLYGHRFYVNDKNRREAIHFFEENESDEERNSGITYGRVRKRF